MEELEWYITRVERGSKVFTLPLRISVKDLRIPVTVVSDVRLG